MFTERVAIFGAARSGRAAKELALQNGFEVALFDQAGSGDYTEFTKKHIEEFDIFVLSPGFGSKHPWRKLVSDSEKKIQSEVAFASDFWPGKIVGVTGTNGKTTTTELLTDAYVCAGFNAVAVGNIGFPFSTAAMSVDYDENSIAVCEVSSFQAELTEGLELDAVLWTNFSEDHLDRYGTMPEYFKAKAKLFDRLKPGGTCVLSPQVTSAFAHFDCDFEQYIMAETAPELTEALNSDSPFSRYPFSENFCLAASFWQSEELNLEHLIDSANHSVLPSHRLSLVAEKDGVRFWNDSKATNFHAALAALDAMQGPVVWLGGGQSKGGDLAEFAREVAPRVDAAVLVGQTGPELAKELVDKHDAVYIHENFEEAVLGAARLAQSMKDPDVLFSPAFSSFDLFASYEARGKLFTSIVLGL